jgi:hypothetical protein
MKLPIALAAYSRNAGFLPELRLKNVYPEKTPAADEGVVLLPRPGCASYLTVAGTSVQGLAAIPGTFNGDVVSVQGSIISRNGLTLGSSPTAATGPVRFAASTTEMVMSVGSTLCRTDGAAVTRPTFPDGAGVISVAILSGRFLAVRANSQRFYWSDLLNGTSWPAQNYASAESQPDNLLDILTINDEIALMGQHSVEFWQPTGDLNLPFQRIDGRTYSKGLINTGAAAQIDNGLFWVGDDGIVYRSGPVPRRLSDHGIEEQIQIAGAGNITLFGLIWVGHTFAVLRLPQVTYWYDCETQEWFEASTLGRAGWRPMCGTMAGNVALLGDSLTGTIYTLSDASLTDGPDAIERRFTALVNDPQTLDNIILDAQGGIGTEPLGGGIIIELRRSRDGGQTFGPWHQTTLGTLGRYRARAVWRRMGLFDAPGGVLDFRMTDNAPFSVQGIRVNEPITGRGR